MADFAVEINIYTLIAAVFRTHDFLISNLLNRRLLRGYISFTLKTRIAEMMVITTEKKHRIASGTATIIASSTLTFLVTPGKIMQIKNPVPDKIINKIPTIKPAVFKTFSP